MNPLRSALLTDLYQLTMLQVYVEQHMEELAVFEFFVRNLPKNRNFLLAAGLEQVLEYLTDLHVTPSELRWLEQSGKFSRGLLDYLAQLRFTGDVHAMPEGTLLFPNEPALRITAPLPQAQFVESRVINLLHFQTLIASKAARCVLAAPDKLLVDFGLRRAHGAEAGLLAARAGYIAGFHGTATVLAAPLYGIPLYGTMAHSFVQAHENELVAFERFARTHPENVVLLIDTYDTVVAAHKVVELAPRLKKDGIHIKGVRLDSGDFHELAPRVRAVLDKGGCPEIRLFASGNLDEHALQDLRHSKAPIDGFGVGTHLDTSADRPYLDCAYKLQEYAGQARRKLSEGKVTWPGRKQVFRYVDTNGVLRFDVLGLECDDDRGEALLKPVMRQGKRLHPPLPLNQLRDYAGEQLSRLPQALRSLDQTSAYEVQVSDTLQRLAIQVDKTTRGN